jgi:predicted TIM-barrel fold metal-dependent hydrolase
MPKFLDFTDIPVVDAHVHTPVRWESEDNILGLGENDYFRVAGQILPPNTDKRLQTKVLKEVRDHSRSRPAATSILHYYRDKYRLNTVDRRSVDRFVRNSIKKLGARPYMLDVFKGEKIRWVLVDQSHYPGVPEKKSDAYPDPMIKWTFPLANIVQPIWAFERKLESLDEAVNAMKNMLKLARKNGCSGFKSIQGYFRDFYLEDVNETDAEKAFKLLRRVKPKSFIDSPAKVPVYSTKPQVIALRNYQDFLLKEAFSEAGGFQTPILIHVAVGEVPQLKPWNNDPSGLYSIFDNKQIQKCNTQFVLLHTGFPAHHAISSIITQYPNVSVDLSWVSHATIFTHTILFEYLTIAPLQKVMHGSDGSHPDVIAFAARSTKKSLSLISQWLAENYGWSESEVTELAEAVLYKNAERIFGKL